MALKKTKPKAKRQPKVHPVVTLAVRCLATEGQNVDAPLHVAPEGLEVLLDRFKNLRLEGEQAFLSAAAELAVLAVYLRRERHSPAAADALEALLVSLPELKAEEAASRVGGMAAEFKKFSTPTTAGGEAKIQTGMSAVSAKDLMRGVIKR